MNKILSFSEIYKLFLEATGSFKNEYKKYMKFYCISFMALGCIYALFLPLFLSLGSGDFADVIYVLGTMILCYVIFGVLKFKALKYDQGGVFIDVGKELRIKLGKKLMNIAQIDLNRYKTGEINSIFGKNVDDSVMFIAMIPAMFLELIIVSAIIVLMAFGLNFTLGLALFVALILAFKIYKLKRQSVIDEKIQTAKAMSQLESDVIEYIQGIGVLRSLGKVGENSIALQTSTEQVRQIQEKALLKSGFLSTLCGALITLIMMICVCAGSYYANIGAISAISVGALLLMISRIAEPLSLALGAGSILDVAQNAFSNTKKLLKIPDLSVQTPNLTPQNFDIKFENVSFSYDGKNRALNGVNFEIKQGSTTAIVGSSGSGKTTITKLLMRYGDLCNGKITIGNADISHISQANLMKLLSVVFQDVYLFNDTIFNNIIASKQNATLSEVENAAKLAYCDFVWNLKDGFNSHVGDIGKSLSGGEKQRISIARAILKNAPIVILDEFSSNLDILGQMSVQRAIKPLVKDKTLIIITHKLSSIKNADQILVFDNAKLVESGNFRQLLDKKGKFFAMWEAENSSKNWRV